MNARDPINRHSNTPLYQQLYEHLRGKIRAGDLRPGDLLPTENDLLDQHQVSRAVVRQALDELVREGLIYRQRGRGTFVAHPTVEQGLVRVVSFTDDMRQRGFTPGTKVISAGLLPAPAEVAANLGIGPGEELARIERLRLADGEPMSIEVSHLVHAHCPGVLRFDFAQEPLREILQRQYDLRIESAHQSIRAIAATTTLAAQLGIPLAAPILFIERVSRLPVGVPVEFLQIFHRGDRYVLYNELRG